MPIEIKNDKYNTISDGQLSLTSGQPFPVFDFATTRKYYIEITASDGLYSTDPQNLTIDINWRNKPPEYSSKTFAFTIPEEQVGRTFTLQDI